MATRISRYGFTLVELAVVLIVIALVSGMGLVATLQTLEGARRAQTESRMDEIEKALMAFRNQYNRLPCPTDITLTDSSSNYGVEAANPGDCIGGTPAAEDISGNGGVLYAFLQGGNFPAVSGGVPTKALNLPAEYMYDGWGRKFLYTIDPFVTAPSAFNYISPSALNCNVLVYDASFGARTGEFFGPHAFWYSGAMYALLSYGPNGHGAYVKGSSTRLSSGSVNIAEQTNCNCDSSAAPSGLFSDFVQQEPTQDPTNPNNSFDDIVRFKERWQLMNADDYVKAASFKGYNMILGFSYGGFGAVPDTPIAFYKRGCNGWVTSNPESITLTSGNAWSHVAGMGLTSDNNYLVAHYYSTSMVGPFFSVVNLTGVTPTIDFTSFFDTHTMNNRIYMSQNNYLFFKPSVATPYIKLYKQNGSQYTQLSNVISAADAPAAQPEILAFSRNIDYLMLARTSSSTYATMYGKVGDTFKKFASPSQPFTSGFSDIKAIAFSPDDRFLAIAVGGGSPAVQLWQIGSGNPYDASGTSPFTSLSSLSLTAAPAVMTFSPDSQYLAVGLAVNSGTISGNIKIYKINGTTFTASTISAATDFYYGDSNTAPYLMQFTPDGNALVISSQGCCIVTLDKVGANTYRQNIPAFHPLQYVPPYSYPDQAASAMVLLR